MFEQRFLFFVVVNICQQSQQKCTEQKHQGDTLVNRHGWNPFINVAHRPHLRGGEPAAAHKTSCANKYIECWFINVVLT